MICWLFEVEVCGGVENNLLTQVPSLTIKVGEDLFLIFCCICSDNMVWFLMSQLKLRQDWFQSHVETCGNWNYKMPPMNGIRILFESEGIIRIFSPAPIPINPLVGPPPLYGSNSLSCSVLHLGMSFVSIWVGPTVRLIMSKSFNLIPFLFILMMS